MEGRKILLVDDDFLNRRLSKKVLSGYGYVIFEAQDASEALHILDKEQIELAILDINLGENQKDGVTLGSELQEKYSVPFIYLTAYDNSDVVKRAIATTPYSYITKPFKNVDLLTAVELAIRQYNTKEKAAPTILVKDGEYNVDLPITEIDYIESSGNYLLFYTAKKVYKLRSTIRQVLGILHGDDFIQTHRAYVVNKLKIDKYNIKSLVVKDIAIPVPKNYIDDISQIYN